MSQITPEKLSLSVEEQLHEQLDLLEAYVKGSELKWSTLEKEGITIFQKFEKMYYLLHCQRQTHVFTDHRNLLLCFAPLALEPALGRHVVSKVQRWDLLLSRFTYEI